MSIFGFSIHNFMALVLIFCGCNQILRYLKALFNLGLFGCGFNLQLCQKLEIEVRMCVSWRIS